MELICVRCKQRPAVVFLSRMEDGKNINEGYCLKCARDMKIPQIDEMIEGLGMSDDDIETLSNTMMEAMQGLGDDEDFSPGGARAFPGFLKKFITNPFDTAGTDKEEQSTELVLSEDSKPPEKAPEKPPERERRRPQGERGEGKNKERKFLDNYCENLTLKAMEGKMDRIIGRDKEIYRVMQILNRRTKNNPCLIGEPGVGKTAIAEGIAQRLVAGEVPPRLHDKELYMLDLTALVAGTQFRGQFETRVKGLVEDIKKAGNVILFIDEVHSLVGAGDAEGSMNAANILKPALSRGEIQVIGATTFNEYRKHIEKDAALERRFQPVTVAEPSIDDTVEVLKGIKSYYELFHKVHVSDDVVRRAVIMSERYITDRYLPDKAIDLLDEACSAAALDNEALYQYEQLNRRLKTLKDKETDMPVDGKEEDFQAAAELKAEISRTERSINALEEKALGRQVTVQDLAKVIELWTSIPATKVGESELGRVADLEARLGKKVVGQEEAVKLVAAAVRRTRISLSVVKRPASFIFVGPTGVGKTELVKVLSKELFDSAEPLIRLDMSEFMEKHTVSRIVGSPPGYVGYDEAGQLTEKVRRRPYSVVLFDEIEKAHPDVLNILLQILDEGRITDAHGRTVSFENTVVVMTSNAGSNIKGSSLGFNKEAKELSREKAMKALSDFLRPEFLARVDEVVTFSPLAKEHYKAIAAIALDEFKTALKEHGMEFGYDESALDYIADNSFGKKAGARDIRRIIRSEVEDQITLRMLESTEGTDSISLVHLSADEGKLVLRTD